MKGRWEIMSNINLTCDVCGREVRGYTWTNGMRFCAKCYQETFGNKITTDMLLDMIKNTGWDVNGVGVLKNIDAEAIIMRQEKQISDLEAKLAERNADLHQIYSHLGVEAFCEDIHEQALKEIGRLQQQLTDKSQKIATLGDNYARLDEKYDFLQSAHEAVVEESLGYEKEIEQLKQQLAEKERTIATLIEDSKASKELLKRQLAEKDNKIQMLNAMIATLPEHDKELKEICNQDKISFCIEKLEQVKAELVNKVSPVNLSYTEYVQEVFNKLNNQIEQLKKDMK